MIYMNKISKRTEEFTYSYNHTTGMWICNCGNEFSTYNDMREHAGEKPCLVYRKD